MRLEEALPFKALHKWWYVAYLKRMFSLIPNLWDIERIAPLED
jgi:hypothetical protein